MRRGAGVRLPISGSAGWQGPVALGFALLLVIGGLRAVGGMLTLLLVRQLGPSDIGQVYAVLGWGGMVGSLGLLIGLSVGLAILVRSVSRRHGQWAALLIACLLLVDSVSLPAGAQTSTGKVAAVKNESGPTLDKAIALWKSGKKEESITAFLDVDFARRPLFPAGSILGYSERQFIELPSSAREKVQAQLIADVKGDRGGGSGDRGQAAVKGGRKAEAEKCFEALARCGAAFE